MGVGGCLLKGRAVLGSRRGGRVQGKFLFRMLAENNKGFESTANVIKRRGGGTSSKSRPRNQKKILVSFDNTQMEKKKREKCKTEPQK